LFGHAAYTPPHVVPVLYVTEEDPPSLVAERLESLKRGHGLAHYDDVLALMVKRGLDLDDRQHQEQFIAEVKDLGIAVVILDPIRSLTTAVDQGPGELQPFVRFLRRLIAETGVAIVLSHHDTKPAAGRPDGRSLSQRASGGGVFALSDSPISLASLAHDPLTILVSPGEFKFSAPPRPFTLELTQVGPDAMAFVRRELAEAVGQREPILEILEHVRANPGANTTAIAKDMRRQKARIQEALSTLQAGGQVRHDVGQRGAKHWYAV
jgi:hypothetical protein